MERGEHKTMMQAETVFVLQGFFPPRKDGQGQHTPGHWSTLYAWCYANHTDSLDEAARKRLATLKKKAQGWTGVPGKLNLHSDGLAYVERADAHAAVKMIRAWRSCKYKVRVVRETVWKEVVIDEYPKEPLLRPFYWPPGSAGDRNAAGDTIEVLRQSGLISRSGRLTKQGRRALESRR